MSEVRAWWSHSDAAPSWALDVLSEEERERHARFHFAADRDSYLAAHSMLRLVLGGYRGAFSTGTHGKPFLEGGPELSLSHTHGLVAVAMAPVPVGVDVESVDRTNDWRRLMRRTMHPAEIAALLALPPPEQQPRFYELWTLKEAWSKALGLGLHADFPSMNSMEADVMLSLHRIEPSYRLAVAAMDKVRVTVERFEWGRSFTFHFLNRV